jgi:hypothetical protein
LPRRTIRVRTTLPVRVTRSAKSAQQVPPAGVPATEEQAALTTRPARATPAETSHAPIETIRPPRRALVPLAGGLGALVLGGLGEALVESGNTTVLSLFLYLAGIGLFAWSASLLPPALGDMPSKDSPPECPRRGDRLFWAILGIGVGAAVALNLAAFLMLRDDLKSEPGKWLWLLSLGVILATGIALHRRHSWPARWLGGTWPHSASGRQVVIASIVVIGLVAVAARFLGLDQVPFGINADEGDRAATAIQIVRGTNTESVFGDGWYHISMVYFTLLSWLFKLIGIGFVQARVFGATASVITLAIIIWIGSRHFSWRVGLMAGGVFAVLGIALQFARETTESGPTATLWALSMALFLEAARTGRMWAWVGAGLAGGFSVYFYPTGRLWAALAALVCVYFFVHGLGGRRVAVARGIVVAAVAGIMIMSPFAANIARTPENFTLRAAETSIFNSNNPPRLRYYNHEWSTPQLVVEQTIRGVGAFNQFVDDGGFWPTDKPIMNGLLVVLTLLGIGWASLKVRDPRYVVLALWFWLGLVGVIVTVETPNFQRMGTAIPTLAFFSVLVLDSLIRRVQTAASRSSASWTPRVAMSATVAAALLVAWIGIGQATFYFGDYGKRDRWPQSTIQGEAVNEQGVDTLTMSIGRGYHMVNSGWVQLLAPETPRGGLKFPGNDLPLTRPADSNLAFMVFPEQHFYIPYLRSIYPSGSLQDYTHPSEGTVVSMYRVSQEAWAAAQGAKAQVEGGDVTFVPTLGAVPAGIAGYPAHVTWTAGLRVLNYWNYSFRIGPGPARLSIDGTEVVNVPAGEIVAEATVSLAAGDHALTYEGTVEMAGKAPTFEWAEQGVPDGNGVSLPLQWRPTRTEELFSEQSVPRGLFGVVQVEGRPEQHLLSNALALCCVSGLVRNDGKPYSVTWTGSLEAPSTGSYTMTLHLQGRGHLLIDGTEVIRRDAPADEPFSAGITLGAGKHAVELKLETENTRGDVEWRWTPPGGEDSIVPPSALSPPDGGVSVGAPLDLRLYADLPVILGHEPLETVR